MGYSEGGFAPCGRATVDYTACQGAIVFDKIREWARTPDGIAHLRACELPPDGFHVDHVVPDHLGGPSHVCNAHLMPASANSHFGDRFDAEKRAFVGPLQVGHALRVMRWMRTRSDWPNFEA